MSQVILLILNPLIYSVQIFLKSYLKNKIEKVQGLKRLEGESDLRYLDYKYRNRLVSYEI